MAQGQLAGAQALGGVDDAIGRLRYSDADTRRASEIAANIDKQAAGYRQTLAELDAMMGKPAAQIRAKQFDALIAKVNAFGAALPARKWRRSATRSPRLIPAVTLAGHR